MNKIIELVAFVKRAKNRRKVFFAVDQLTMPSDIVRELFKKWSSSRYAIISRALSELVGKGLIKIENPKEKVGRMYSLTALGKKVIKKLK